MIALLLLLAFELLRNWYVIAKLKQEPNHARGWALRVLVIAFVAFAKFDLDPIPTIKYGLGCGIAFWLPFDIGLNLLRGKVWNYLGRSAVLDRLNLPGDLEVVIKFVLMCVGIWLILGVQTA
jgi:hypothetical protein